MGLFTVCGPSYGPLYGVLTFIRAFTRACEVATLQGLGTPLQQTITHHHRMHNPHAVHSLVGAPQIGKIPWGGKRVKEDSSTQYYLLPTSLPLHACKMSQVPSMIECHK